MSAQLFFDLVENVTKQVFSQASTRSHFDFEIAALKIRLLFAGESMPSLVLPALRHLQVHSNDFIPDFYIQIWDSVTSGQELPPFPGKLEDIQLRGEITGLNDERYHSAFFPYARMLSVYDTSRRTGIICTGDPQIMPAFEIACPLRSILSWILKSNSRAFIHAAAVGTKHGAVLLGGDGGAGKSSTAIRSLLAGMLYIGDDICCLENRADGSYAHSIYSSAKLHSYDVAKFPGLDRVKFINDSGSEHEKQMYFLSPLFEKQLVSTMPIKAVLIPDHSGGPLRFEQISAANVVKVMTASTNCLLPRAGVETLKNISTLLHRTPCLRMHLGPNPMAIAPAIESFLESHF